MRLQYRAANGQTQPSALFFGRKKRLHQRLDVASAQTWPLVAHYNADPAARSTQWWLQAQCGAHRHSSVIAAGALHGVTGVAQQVGDDLFDANAVHAHGWQRAVQRQDHLHTGTLEIALLQSHCGGNHRIDRAKFHHRLAACQTRANAMHNAPRLGCVA